MSVANSIRSDRRRQAPLQPWSGGRWPRRDRAPADWTAVSLPSPL